MKEIEFNLVIDNNNSYFEKYLKLIQTKVDDDQKYLASERRRVRKIILDEEEENLKSEGNEYLAELHFQMFNVEQLMYRSFVISVFVFMESQITSLCNHIEESSSQVFSHKDLVGNGIGRSIKYLEKVLGKDFPNSLYLKPRFEIAQKIRNALVHNYGVIKDNDISQIKAFIKQNPDILELSKDGEVYVTYKYAEAMLSLNKEICKEVSKNWKVKS